MMFKRQNAYLSTPQRFNLFLHFLKNPREQHELTHTFSLSPSFSSTGKEEDSSKRRYREDRETQREGT